MKDRAEHVFDITADRILQELASVGFANLRDFFQLDGNGAPQLALDRAARHQWAGLAKVTVEETRTSKRAELKLLDKKGALIEHGKHAGLCYRKQETDVEKLLRAQIEAAADDFDTHVNRLLEGEAKRAQTEGKCIESRREN